MMGLHLKGATVLDIGASHGIYCFWMMRAVGPSGNVIGAALDRHAVPDGGDEHIDIMNTGAFERLIRNIFGSSRSTRRPIMDHPVVSISVGKKDIGQNELMEVLLIPDSRTTNMTGRLVFEEISAGTDDQSVTFSPTGSDISITYQGPPISSLKVEVPAPQAAGAYRISFEGTHRTAEDTTAVIFVGPFSEKQIVNSAGTQRRKKVAKKTKAKKSKK
jgi:hypothetical protein